MTSSERIGKIDRLTNDLSDTTNLRAMLESGMCIQFWTAGIGMSADLPEDNLQRRLFSFLSPEDEEIIKKACEKIEITLINRLSARKCYLVRELRRLGAEAGEE